MSWYIPPTFCCTAWHLQGGKKFHFTNFPQPATLSQPAVPTKSACCVVLTLTMAAQVNCPGLKIHHKIVLFSLLERLEGSSGSRQSWTGCAPHADKLTLSFHSWRSSWNWDLVPWPHPRSGTDPHSELSSSWNRLLPHSEVEFNKIKVVH